MNLVYPFVISLMFPMFSTTCLAMARPRPVPIAFSGLVSADKGIEDFSFNTSGIPMPSSVM